MECLDSRKQINWPGFIIRLLHRVDCGTKTHVIPCGFILIVVLAHFKVSLKTRYVCMSKDYFGVNTLTNFYYGVHIALKEPSSSKRVPKNNKVRALEHESGVKDAETERLKTSLAEVEVERYFLKYELKKEKEKNEGIIQDMLKLL